METNAVVKYVQVFENMLLGLQFIIIIGSNNNERPKYTYGSKSWYIKFSKKRKEENWVGC